MIVYANELPFETTEHGVGLKKIFLRSPDTETMLTQFAHGKLFPGDKIPEHSHVTMEEVFYFFKGEGIYTLGHDKLHVSIGTVVRIPAGVTHSLTTSGKAALEFLYFGIATE